MTASQTARLHDEASGPVPHRATAPIAANTLLLKGCLFVQDASGNAVAPTDGDGFPAWAIANATYDNRTGSEAGGLAGDLDAEGTYGVFKFAYTGAAPKPRDLMFVVDNQTVSVDSDSSARGVAGFCCEGPYTAEAGYCYVWIAPYAVGEAAVDLAALEADAERENAHFDVPISAFRIYSSGLTAAAWVDGSVDGIDPTAESAGIRWNPASTVAFAACMNLPTDIAAGSAITIHLLGARVGALDVTAAITCGVFFRVPGAAFNADATAGGDSTAFDGATTVVTEETLVVAAGDVPEAAPASMLLTVVPTAALDADDLILLGVRCTYTRALQG